MPLSTQQHPRTRQLHVAAVTTADTQLASPLSVSLPCLRGLVARQPAAGTAAVRCGCVPTLSWQRLWHLLFNSTGVLCCRCCWWCLPSLPAPSSMPLPVACTATQAASGCPACCSGRSGQACLTAIFIAATVRVQLRMQWAEPLAAAASNDMQGCAGWAGLPPLQPPSSGRC